MPSPFGPAVLCAPGRPPCVAPLPGSARLASLPAWPCRFFIAAGRASRCWWLRALQRAPELGARMELVHFVLGLLRAPDPDRALLSQSRERKREVGVEMIARNGEQAEAAAGVRGAGELPARSPLQGLGEAGSRCPRSGAQVCKARSSQSHRCVTSANARGPAGLGGCLFQWESDPTCTWVGGL